MEIVIPMVALLASILLAGYLLTRQRRHARPDNYDPAKPAPGFKPTRQQRILEKLEPLPEIPSVMDLMRQELAETGVETIPGHEGLAGPVMLKVYRRDHLVRERCTHDGFEFVVREGVSPSEATDGEVILFCGQCGEIDPVEEEGTESDTETL